MRQDSLRLLSCTGNRKEMAYLLRYLAHVGHTPWETKELYQEASAIFEAGDDGRGRVETLYRLGWVATQLGDYQEAEQLYQQSLSLAQELGRQEIVTNCLLELGYVYWVFGDYQVAERHCRESISVSTEIGYHGQIALAHRYLARIAVGRSDYQNAKKHLGDSLAIYEEIGLRGMRASALGELAHVQVIDGDIAQARQLAEECIAICEELEHRAGLVEPFMVLGEIARRLADLQGAETHFRTALQTAMEVWATSYALHILARIAILWAEEGDKERALDLASFISRHPASWQWSKDSIQPLVAELHAGPAPEVVTAAWELGNGKTLQEMVEEILS